MRPHRSGKVIFLEFMPAPWGSGAGREEGREDVLLVARGRDPSIPNARAERSKSEK